MINPDIPLSDETRLLAMDQMGFYWLGGSTGLRRFDGQQWKHYTIRADNDTVKYDQYINSKGYFDQNGKLWFSTYMALHSFDPMTEVFRAFQVSHGKDLLTDAYTPFFLDEQRQEVLLRAGRSLWAFSIEKEEFRLLKETTQENSMDYFSGENEIEFWGAPWWYNQRALEFHKYVSGGMSESQMITVPEMVKEVAVYQSDSLYLCTPGGVLLITNPKNDSLRQIESVISGDCRHLVFDPGRKKLFASIDQRGIQRIEPRMGIVDAVLDSARGLSGNNARTLQFSDDGVLFISHNSEGLDILLPSEAYISFSSVPSSVPLMDLIDLPSGNLLLNDQSGMLWEMMRSDGVSEWITKAQNKVRNLLPDGSFLQQTLSGGIFGLGHASLSEIDAKSLNVSTQTLDYSLYRGIVSTKSDELIYLRMHQVMILDETGTSRPLPGVTIGWPRRLFLNHQQNLRRPLFTLLPGD